MTENVESMILEVLKSIQGRLGALEQKVDHIATIVQKQRRDIAGILVMMKATVGDFDQRVTAMDERMAAYDSRS